jgi:hypothetical protein
MTTRGNKMTKVVDIGGVTRLNLPVDRVLESAKDTMTGVVLLGYDKEDNEYFASTFADGGDVLWLLRRCEQKLLDMGDLK